MAKYWLTRQQPFPDGPMTVSKAPLARAEIMGQLKSYPELYNQASLMQEDREGGWKRPACFGFSKIKDQEAERAFQAEVAKLKQKDTDDILWIMFIRGARWAEGWLAGKSQVYQVELVWNREFDWTPRGDPHTELASAIREAKEYLDMGDGACVKKTRVVDDEGKVVWNNWDKVP